MSATGQACCGEADGCNCAVIDAAVEHALDAMARGFGIDGCIDDACSQHDLKGDAAATVHDRVHEEQPDECEAPDAYDWRAA